MSRNHFKASRPSAGLSLLKGSTSRMTFAPSGITSTREVLVAPNAFDGPVVVPSALEMPVADGPNVFERSSCCANVGGRRGGFQRGPAQFEGIVHSRRRRSESNRGGRAICRSGRGNRNCTQRRDIG